MSEWNEKMNATRILHREKPLVYVARSPIHGRGLFAATGLPAGGIIGNYEGSVVKEDGVYVLWVEDRPGGEWIGYDGSNELRFMNHADRPNAEMDGLICYALEDISTGDEITIDYGWNDS
jgi:SET domain-containing protein